MHPNPIFRDDDQGRGLTMARARGFGVLTVNGAEVPLAAHVPFVADGTEIGSHLVRSNPIARALKAGSMPALLVVSGPDGYISPDWYGVDDQVPTWNYVAVHIRGRLELLPDDTLRQHLDQVSALFEAALAPKRPWTMDKLTDQTMAKLMRMIVPTRMVIEHVDATWKLNQNKTSDARAGAAAALRAGGGAGQGLADLAVMMEGLPDG